jgi:hypothetical protein
MIPKSWIGADRPASVDAMKRTAALILSLTVAASAAAHHSFAVFFDTQDKLVKVTGVVTDFRFSNPHGVITLIVPRGNTMIVWRAETNSPSILRRRGWSQDSLHIGDRVTLSGWPAKDGTHYIRLQSAQLSDGRMVGQPLG